MLGRKPKIATRRRRRLRATIHGQDSNLDEAWRTDHEVKPRNELTIVETLDAPRKEVWQACRDADALRHWWGMPHGLTMPVCHADFQLGGEVRFATQRPGASPSGSNASTGR